MKIKLMLEIEFDSWFVQSREPKTNQEWIDFFIQNNLITQSSVIGDETEEYQDMVSLKNYCITPMGDVNFRNINQ